MTLEFVWSEARSGLYLALLGGALVLSGMLGAGGAAKIARLKVDEGERRRLTGAALLLWVASSAAVMAVALIVLPNSAIAMAAGCALALVRLALSLRFNLRASPPGAEAFDALLRAGVKPLIASALFLPLALLSKSLMGAALCAALLLAADAAVTREGAERLRAAGRLTLLFALFAALLALFPGRLFALTALFAAWIAAVWLSAGPGALLRLPSALYEAYLPVRARVIRRRAGAGAERRGAKTPPGDKPRHL